MKSFSRIPAETIAERPVAFRVLVEGVERPLHALVRDDVYRIGREAIINALRHAEAANIELDLRYSDAGLRVFVRDDGRGMDHNFCGRVDLGLREIEIPARQEPPDHRSKE